jgi:PAS domain S-box-containing protein
LTTIAANATIRLTIYGSPTACVWRQLHPGIYVSQQPILHVPLAPNTQTLQANANQLAESLAHVVGAQSCYLALTEPAQQRFQIIVVSGEARRAPYMTQVAPLLRQVCNQPQSMRAIIHSLPALGLPLYHAGKPIGATVLVYPRPELIDEQRALAAAALVTIALDAARTIAEMHTQAEEIEERIRVREIQVSRNLIRGVIDSIPLGLTLLDMEGTVLAVNRTLAKRFGRDPAGLVGKNYGAVIGSWEQSSAAQTFVSGIVGRVRRTINGADGAQTLLEISSFPLLDNEGRPRQVVEVWEDITERVALQTQLVRAERLAAIGQLAASIAHEVGNPLQAIQGFLALFLEQCAGDTPNRAYLELAEEEIQRIVKVIARLRDLYRPRADVVASVDVNDLIDNVLLLTGKQLERFRIRAICELDSTLPFVMGVADQLKQVLLNLVLNAIDAMPDGGVLHVQTTHNAALTDGQTVSIMVTDIGAGISPEQLPHIFDGLHTTKERGMGLGLYTSKAIIERHMGRISVQSIVGEGTTFTIVLPVGSTEEKVV